MGALDSTQCTVTLVTSLPGFLRLEAEMPGYSVTFDKDDIDQFNDNWPCSELCLPDGADEGFFEFDSNGDLVDTSLECDGPEVATFMLDCQATVNPEHAKERGWT